MSIRAVVIIRTVLSSRHNSVHRLRPIRSEIALAISLPTRTPLRRTPLTIAFLARRLLDSAQYNAVGEGQRRGRTELAERRRRRHRYRPALVTYLWGEVAPW